MINFTKMHGCGNDYIYIDCLKEEIKDPEKLSVTLSDRHFGIGGDGLVLICPSNAADARMRIFNADGSEGEMCGNAIRCVAKYLLDNKIVNKTEIKIETLSGIKTLAVKGEKITVDMGAPILSPRDIPVLLDGDSIINRELTVGGKKYFITCVSMGNPHCVVFCENVSDLNLWQTGPEFENHPLFPQRINTEFVQIIDENTIKMRVWERGSGETLACGTGACAAAVASTLNGYCTKNKPVKVILKGGELEIMYTDKTVYMTGEAKKVFTGQI